MKISVVIGRFQVPYLTEGHRYLLDNAKERGDELIVLLGCTGGQPTKRNPLDFAVRQRMIEDAYPGAIVAAVFDHPSDEAWSKRVDGVIASCITTKDPILQITIYGSRDSFHDHYSGQFDTLLLPEATKGLSGTKLRERTSTEIYSTPAFRAGAIYSVYNRYPGVYLCVDVAILTERQDAVLLGRKSGMTKWQFVGGFVDPDDANITAAARRETWEETQVHADDLKVIGNFKVNDSRYRGTEASMFTVFFKCTHKGGMWKASDDIEELCWFPIRSLRTQEDLVIDIHQPLLDALITNINYERI